MRREDQEKINKFSTLHQKEERLEGELRGKQVSFLRPTFATTPRLNHTCLTPISFYFGIIQERTSNVPGRTSFVWIKTSANSCIERERGPRRDIHGARARRRGGESTVSPQQVPLYPKSRSLTLNKTSYKIGDCFVSLPQPEVLELLSASSSEIDDDVSTLKERLDTIHDEMEELKKALYGRFGRSINLET